MRTVVSVSATECVRMVAIVVLQRPENAGKSVGAIELHTQDGNFERMNVVVFDTAEEAMAQSAQLIGAQGATVGPGAVLQLVRPATAAGPTAKFEARDQVRLKSGGPTMTVEKIDYAGDVWCSWRQDGMPMDTMQPFAPATLEKVS